MQAKIIGDASGQVQFLVSPRGPSKQALAVMVSGAQPGPLVVTGVGSEAGDWEHEMQPVQHAQASSVQLTVMVNPRPKPQPHGGPHGMIAPAGGGMTTAASAAAPSVPDTLTVTITNQLTKETVTTPPAPVVVLIEESPGRGG